MLWFPWNWNSVMVSLIFSLFFKNCLPFLEEKAFLWQEKYGEGILKYPLAMGNPGGKEFPSQSLVFSWNLWSWSLACTHQIPLALFLFKLIIWHVGASNVYRVIMNTSKYWLKALGTPYSPSSSFRFYFDASSIGIFNSGYSQMLLQFSILYYPSL